MMILRIFYLLRLQVVNQNRVKPLATQIDTAAKQLKGHKTLHDEISTSSTFHPMRKDQGWTQIILLVEISNAMRFTSSDDSVRKRGLLSTFKYMLILRSRFCECLPIQFI